MKKVVIMRGPSGSGKSTLAQQIMDDFKGSNKIIVSADNFHMVDGKYVFQPDKLKLFHQMCFHKFITACSLAYAANEPALIIVDNTNIKQWEFQTYVDVAHKLGFQITYQIPNGEWDAKVFAERNTHGVPEAVIQRMIDNFERMEA